MRRTVLATLLVLAIAGLPTAQAGTVLGSWYDTLGLGKDQTAPFSNCDRLVSCQDLAGVSLVDLDVSDAVAGASGAIRYELKDVGGQGYQLTAWRFCQYDGSGTLIRCDQDASAAYWLMGSINPSTATVRVIMVSGVDRDLHLRIWS